MRVFVFRQYSGKIFFVVAKILTRFVNITHFLCKINLLSISFTHFFHPSIYNIYISLHKFLYRDSLTKEVKAWRTGFKCLISHALNHGTQYPPGELSGLLTFKWNLYPESYSLIKRIFIIRIDRSQLDRTVYCWIRNALAKNDMCRTLFQIAGLGIRSFALLALYLWKSEFPTLPNW